MMRRAWRRLFGVDRWFFFKVKIRSKLSRLRCVLLGGHTYEWKELLGGGKGYDGLVCTRCHCHFKEYRNHVEGTK